MPRSADLLKILRRPGEGLLTVTTGSGAAARTLGKVFTPMSDQKWRARALKALRRSGPHIVALPSDTGGGICRGAAHGPLHLRAQLYQKSPEFARYDLGDLPCIPQILDDSMLSASQLRASGRALWGSSWKPTYPVSPLTLLRAFLLRGFHENPEGFRPFILGGDHSTSIAVTEALFGAGRYPGLAILHLDAHTDLMDTRYGVARCFATWASRALGLMRPCDRKNFVQVGVRTSGHTRRYWENRFGLRQIWSSEVASRSAARFAEELVANWKKAGCDRLYISFDVDALDPAVMPSTGTAEPGGLELRWCLDVIKICANEMRLIAADIVELAPVLGSRSDGLRSSKAAARVANELLLGLLRGEMKS